MCARHLMLTGSCLLRLLAGGRRLHGSTGCSSVQAPCCKLEALAAALAAGCMHTRASSCRRLALPCSAAAAPTPAARDAVSHLCSCSLHKLGSRLPLNQHSTTRHCPNCTAHALPPHPPPPTHAPTPQVIGILAFFKYGATRFLIGHTNMGVAWLFNTLFSLALVAGSSFLVVGFAPSAQGSGVPEVMAYLNGCLIPKVCTRCWP